MIIFFQFSFSSFILVSIQFVLKLVIELFSFSSCNSKVFQLLLPLPLTNLYYFSFMRISVIVDGNKTVIAGPGIYQ